MTLGLAGIFGAGLLTYLTPCVLPLIPMYLAALAGGDLANIGKAGRGRLLFRAGFFALGFLVVFTLMGLGASSLGALLVEHKAVVQLVGGVLILLFGLKFLGFIQIPAFDRILRGSDQRWSERSSALGALMMGVVFAAGWSPCVGPVLGAVLTYTASTTSDPLVGAGYLAVYGAGFALPLLLTAVFAEGGVRLLRKVGPALPKIERAIGAALVIVAGSMMLDTTAGAGVPDTVAALQTRPRMVELYAKDCPICQEMKPVVEVVRGECAGRQVDIEEIDVSEPENRHLIAEHRVLGVPTFVFLDNQGDEVARLIGRQTEDTLFQALSTLVGEECSGVGALPVDGPTTPPCVDNPEDPPEDASCHSTSTNVTPAESSSMTFGNTTSETSRPNVLSAANQPIACSAATL